MVFIGKVIEGKFKKNTNLRDVNMVIKIYYYNCLTESIGVRSLNVFIFDVVFSIVDLNFSADAKTLFIVNILYH